MPNSSIITQLYAKMSEFPYYNKKKSKHGHPYLDLEYRNTYPHPDKHPNR